MSGLVKNIRKVVKKVTGFVKKYWKPILTAVAVYFTAGVALSYFGSTAAFAANLPGFGTAGIFAKAAAWMGFSGVAGSGLHSTAVMMGKIAPMVATTANTTGVLAAGMGAPAAGAASLPAGTLAVNPLTGQAIGSSTLAAGAQAAAGAGATGPGMLAATQQASQQVTTTDLLLKALNNQQKLGYLKLGFDVLSGLTKPDPYEEARKMHALQNAASFGVGRDGNAASGWGSVDMGGAFSSMNKNAPAGNAPQPSAFASQEFLPTEFESQTFGQFAQMPNMQMPQRSGQLPETEFIRSGHYG